MQICRKIEMQYDDWNLIVKAVKASNDKIGEYAEETFRIIRPKFITLCMKQGIEKKGAIRVWDTIVGFTDYGFNRAHATGYGITAYRSAYLKHHHPLEYMQSLLNVWTGTPSSLLSEERTVAPTS